MGRKKKMMVPPLRFKLDVAKSTQAAAYVAGLAGDRISKIKLIKALYFADREQLLRIGKPITGDHPCSMPHGPVLSRIYNLIKGEQKDQTWHGSLLAEGKYWVVRVNDPGTDLLSPNEKVLLQQSFEKIQHMDWQQLRDYCHDKKHCPELEEVTGTSKPIRFETILERGGKSAAAVEDIRAHNLEEQQMAHLFA